MVAKKVAKTAKKPKPAPIVAALDGGYVGSSGREEAHERVWNPETQSYDHFSASGEPVPAPPAEQPAPAPVKPSWHERRWNDSTSCYDYYSETGDLLSL